MQEQRRLQQEYATKQKEQGAERGSDANVSPDTDCGEWHNYRRWFNEMLTEAVVENYSRHCNRHTFASRLVVEETDLRTVVELMGHSSTQMTMRRSTVAPLWIGLCLFQSLFGRRRRAQESPKAGMNWLLGWSAVKKLFQV
ncbi:MAG: tyrosine-type recombinase/integrase [Acidobacteriaceae bacterium]